jgi:S1-C subfamily serine protease
VRVAGVAPGGPAERAGLREGDLVVGFAERPVLGIDDLQRYLSGEMVGVEVSVTVVRRAERSTVVVVPAEAADGAPERREEEEKE